VKASHSLGQKGEALAIQYLEKLGYTILGRNFRYDRAEIDLIARDKDVLVFVEVKTRRPGSLGDPEDAVTARKQNQLVKAAEGYLHQFHLSGSECRFDVVAIEINGSRSNIRHITDAF
jgi:putative endonuclease